MARSKRQTIIHGQPYLNALFFVALFQAYKYQEDYELALAGFGMASKLDPMWQEAKDKRQELLGFLENVTELVQCKVRNKLVGTALENVAELCLTK